MLEYGVWLSGGQTNKSKKDVTEYNMPNSHEKGPGKQFY